MSLLLLFANQDSVQLDRRARRRVTIVLSRRRHIHVVTPEEERERELAGATHEVQRLSTDYMAQALAEDEELLLGLI